jgi:hypothetical protein
MTAATPLSVEFLRPGAPSPFTLRNRAGTVIVPRGGLIESVEQCTRLAEAGVYIDQHDQDLLTRALAGKVAHLMEGNALLGQIAAVRADAGDIAAASGGARVQRRRLGEPATRWSSFQLRLRALLGDSQAPEWVDRLDDLQCEQRDMLVADHDDTLLALIYPASREPHDYSASHATLVACIVHMARVHTPGWNFAWDASLRLAALTMNIAMTALQNQLALQPTPPNARQRQLIDLHATEGARMLREAGVRDALALAAVEAHHTAPPGDWGAMPPAMRLARLIARADRFCAQLAPRRTRAARSAQAAARSAYLGEDGQPDVAGSAILKAVGLYPAGSFVQLRNGEVAIVLRRQAVGTKPIVATVQNAQGMPLTDPLLRRDPTGPHEIVKALAPGEVNLRLPLDKLFQLG